MSAATAHVEVLTAEVRTLMVGSRQVTLSVYKQLDDVEPEEMQPFGRVRSGKADHMDIELVGQDLDTGVLVRATVYSSQQLDEALVDRLPYGEGYRVSWRSSPRLLEIHQSGRRVALYNPANNEWSDVWDYPKLTEAIASAEASRARQRETYDRYESLPLIVLAGLR